MPSRRSYRWSLFAILALALAIRLAASVWWQERLPVGRDFFFADSEGYWELGRKVARGQPYEFGPERYAIFRTPGYPILLAGLFVVDDDDPPVLCGRALSAVLGTVAVWGVAALGKLLFDRRVALAAAAITAVYPEAIALSTFVLSEAPFCPLMVWQLVAWGKAWNRGSTTWAGIAGLLAGLATLVRPSWLLFVPFALLAGLAYGPDRRKQTLIGGVMLAALCVTMMPWWARNYLIAGRLVPTTLQVGASLYDGLSPQATGASDMRFVPQFVAEQHAADVHEGADLRGSFEERLDRRMHDASLDWVKENPGRVIQLMWIKLLRMWNPLPNAAELGGGGARIVLALTYTPVMILAIVGVWRFARQDWPYLLLVIPAVYFTCLHVIFVSSIRYRQPAMLLLIVLAAAVIVELTRKREGEAPAEPRGSAGASPSQ